MQKMLPRYEHNKRLHAVKVAQKADAKEKKMHKPKAKNYSCLLYTSDAADE